MPFNARRWLRFSLATMFVVLTIVAALLFVPVRMAHRRHEALRELRQAGAKIIFDGDDDSNAERILHSVNTYQPMHRPKVPLSPWRKLVGDHAVYSIHLPSELFTGNEVDSVAVLFPEAYVDH